MSPDPCKSECDHLIALAREMGGTGVGAPFLTAWLTHAQAVQNSPMLETLDGERMVDDLALDLRRRWLQHCHKTSSTYMMSPPHTQAKYLSNGTRVHYPYERWLKPEALEARLLTQQPPPTGWNARAVVFANAMSAITTMFQTYRNRAAKLWPRPGTAPLSLHWFGGYFEISRALELLCGGDFFARKHARQQTLCDAVARGEADLVLIEPVAANLKLEVFDLDAFVQAWQRRPATARPCTLIIDTSLCADTFRGEDLCQKLATNPPALVVMVRSALKLDQHGLELANAGLVSLLARDGEASSQALERFTATLRLARTTLGAGLSQNEQSALSVPFFLTPGALAVHTRAVFAHNRELAQRLNAAIATHNGVIDAVYHPSLSPLNAHPWAQAPYVNIHFQPDDDSARGFLRAVLEHEIKAQKLRFCSGSSFGFRSHRFEMGFAKGYKYTTLRVAMGARAGLSCEGVIGLFERLCAHRDFAALRAAYPHIPANAKS